ncbi:MAG: Uma2 family endonuclease [Anaerolineae bacterium]|nr:Uma2 family endonuclease [Anaerolineae bacterium]
MTAPPATTRMTATEFLALPESIHLTQLLRGEMSVTPAPTAKHQRLVLEIAIVIKNLKLAGVAYIAPMDVRLDDTSVVQPDVMWVAAGNTQCVLVDDKYWQGAPDLVVEVLSPATARQDRGVKFDLYQQHGTREYWIIDPAAEYVEVWRHDGEQFARGGVFGPDDTFTSDVLGGNAVNVSALFDQ